MAVPTYPGVYIEEFTPGLWESLVGDPHGDIPQDVLDHVDASVRDPSGPTGEVDHE